MTTLYTTKEMTREQKNEYYKITKQKIINLSFGVHSIDRLVYKENELLFIECIKIMIDNQFPQENGFTIDFSDDYKRIKKFINI